MYSKLCVVGLVTALFCLALAPGCGSRANKVEGKVTLDGNPIEGATVQFVPLEKGRGHPASGLTGSDGQFRLQTYVSGDGAEPGEYAVLITKRPRQAAPGIDTRDGNKMKQVLPDSLPDKSGKLKAVPRNELPEKYGSVDKTPFKCTVPVTDSLTFELKSK